jgi:hypothetical protein
MFEKYDKKTRRRIYSLLSVEIDTNVKLGIIEARNITDNFIKEIQKKELDTWISLRKYIDSKYFYDECIRYIDENISKYIDRYKGQLANSKVTDGQAKFLVNLIEKTVKHENYKVRMKGLELLQAMVCLLSKSSASHYIDIYKEVLDKAKTEISNKEGEHERTNKETDEQSK